MKFSSSERVDTAVHYQLGLDSGLGPFARRDRRIVARHLRFVANCRRQKHNRDDQALYSHLSSEPSEVNGNAGIIGRQHLLPKDDVSIKKAMRYLSVPISR